MVSDLGAYLSDLATALAGATRRVDGIAGMAASGQLPRIGDELPPWEVRGWLLPYVMDLLPADSGVGRGRWGYWLRCLEAGRLPPDPIPPCPFEGIEDGSRTPAGKMLLKCLDLIDAREGHWRSECASQLLEWLAWGLHVSPEPCRLKPATQEALYRVGGFCIDPMLDRPADYFGWMLSELKGRGTDPRGFYPTPMDVALLLGQMTFPLDGADCRRQTVCDPCVGTGRMLLTASNWSLRLYGQDIDGRCCLATLVNGAIYAPWLAFPLPDRVFGEPPELPPAFNAAGQGLLFPAPP
jgi:hypothetical protein